MVAGMVVIAYFSVAYLMSVRVKIIYDGTRQVCSILLDGDAIIVYNKNVPKNLLSDASFTCSPGWNSRYSGGERFSVEQVTPGKVHLTVFGSEITYLKYRSLEINGKKRNLPLLNKWGMLDFPNPVVFVNNGIHISNPFEGRWTSDEQPPKKKEGL